ncbi:MAG: hypothetical protein KatS3mg105_2371 [Gemmatales bacterium]|nr:MAG: hypothetical protein KatS3mg105_2371 [Gemmatales bacterium]
MFRNRWTATVLVAVISAAQAVPQTMTPSPVPTSSQIITVKEPGKPDQRCRILKSWVEPDGSVAFEVQALDTGEKMTIVQASDAVPLKNGTRPGKEMVQAMRSRIYHWIRNTVPPPGAPLAPPVVEETIVSSPQVPAPVIVKEPSRIRPIVKPAPVVVERRPRLRPVVTPPVVAKKAKPEGSEDKAEGGLLRKSLQSLFTKRPSSKPQPMKLPRVFKQELTPKKADSAPSSQTAQKPLNYSREPVRRVAQTPKTAPPKAKVGSTSISLEKNKADDKQQADKGKNTDKSGQGPSLLTSDVPPPADAKEKQPEPKIEAAKPTDWHQSWGKTDDHKTELPKARSEKDDPLEDPTKFVKWPQLEPKEDKKPDAVEDKTKSDVASKSADGKEAKADPKEEYKKNLKAAENAKATDQPTGFRAILAKILSKDKRPSAPTGKEPASDVPIPNPYAGAKSVLSATSPGGQVVYVPVPVVTVPQRTAPQPPYPPAMPPQSAPQLVPAATLSTTHATGCASDHPREFVANAECLYDCCGLQPGAWHGYRFLSDEPAADWSTSAHVPSLASPNVDADGTTSDGSPHCAASRLSESPTDGPPSGSHANGLPIGGADAHARSLRPGNQLAVACWLRRSTDAGNDEEFTVPIASGMGRQTAGDARLATKPNRRGSLGTGSDK